MRLLGMLLLTASAAFIGISKANELRERTDALREVISMLELLHSEICTRHTPVKRALAVIPENSFHAFRFAKDLSESMTRLGENSFFSLWSDSIERTLGILTQTQITALVELGHSIGRYDAAVQSAAIGRCAETLSGEYGRMYQELKNSRKMYIGIGTGTGLILSIILI